MYAIQFANLAYIHGFLLMSNSVLIHIVIFKITNEKFTKIWIKFFQVRYDSITEALRLLGCFSEQSTLTVSEIPEHFAKESQELILLYNDMFTYKLDEG